LALTILASAAFASELRSQVLRGTVLQADGRTPAAGILVEAVDSLLSERIANVLTDARGAFVLRLPPSRSALVRGLRVGQRPSTFGIFSLARGETKTDIFTLTGAVLLLSDVRVVQQLVCGNIRDSTQTVTTLMEEARKALRSARLLSESAAFSADWTVARRRTTLQGQSLEDPEIRRLSGATTQPFVSRSADSLLTLGYFEETASAIRFFAPDASVILSDAFAVSHCFRVAEQPDVLQSWIGLSFRPVNVTRGVVRIRGTLWFDRTSAELRRIEFDYVNLPLAYSGMNARGWIGVIRLSTGEWLLDRWLIHAPLLVPDIEEVRSRDGFSVSGSRRVDRVSELLQTDGEVRQLRRNGEVVYSAGDIGTREALQHDFGVARLCSVPPAAGRGVAWGRLRTADGTPVAGRIVVIKWREDDRWMSSGQQSWRSRTLEAQSEADGFWMICGVPQARLLDVRIVSDSLAPWMPYRIPAGVPAVELTSATQSKTDVLGSIVGSVFDSLRTGAPWRGAHVALVGIPRRAVADSLGLFVLDSVPTGDHEIVAWDEELLMLRAEPASALVQVLEDGSSRPIRLTTRSATTVFAGSCEADRALGNGHLLGELRDTKGTLLPGVDVSVSWTETWRDSSRLVRETFISRDTSDSRGAYLLCGLPTQSQRTRDGDISIFLSSDLRLTASRRGSRAGPLSVRLEGSALTRRDLVLGEQQERVSLRGRVLSASGTAVAGASVRVWSGEETTAVVDRTGAWAVDSVHVMSSQVTIRAEGFIPQTRAVDPLSGRFAYLDVRLQSTQHSGAAAAIALSTATAFEQRRRRFPDGAFLGVSDLSALGQRTADQVAARIPWARTGDARAGAGPSRIEFRVSRGVDVETCHPRWFVDGNDLAVPSAAEEALMLRAAERLEAYTALTGPEEFTDFDGCGTIVVWTH